MLRSKTVVYCTVDPFLSPRGKFLYAFDQFQSELDRLAIPCVWLSMLSRLQLDEPRRRAGHSEPFIAEDGCGVYLPEDYFHVKPTKTVRLARFTGIPVAKQQPAAAEALESVSEEAGVPVVQLRSLSPRELEQNVGLPKHEAELFRQRDFDEPFFFAGASEQDIAGFKAKAEERKLSIREYGIFYSAALGRDIRRCIRELGDLYDRSLHVHANRVGVATSTAAAEVFPACDRGIRISANAKKSTAGAATNPAEVAITSPDLWDRVLTSITSRG